MKVILTCFQDAEPFGPLTLRQLVAMLPVLNKRLLQHQIEQSVKRGHREIHIVVVDYPSEVEMFVGNGSMWGIDPRVWFFRDPCNGEEVLRRLSEKLDGPFVVIPAETLIDWDFDEILSQHEAQSSGMSRVVSARGISVDPAGQPIIGESGVLEDTGILLTHERFEPQGPITDVDCNCRWIRVDDPRKLWAANLDALRNGFPCLLRSGTETQPGVRIGHHSGISPHSHMDGPHYLGNYVQIRPGAKLLGDSVLGNGTFIDENASVSTSVILAKTYVGPDVELRDSIVKGRFLMMVPIGVWVSVPEPFMLADTRESVALSFIRSLIDKIGAVLLGVITFPVWLAKGLTRILKGKPFFDKRSLMVCDTSGETICPEGGSNREFLWFGDAGPFVARLPGLLDVLMGRMRLVGVRPLHAEALSTYQEEWTWRRFECPEGLFTPVDAEMATHALEEEKAVIENYYASTRNLSTDMKIMVKSIFNLIFRIPRNPSPGKAA